MFFHNFCMENSELCYSAQKVPRFDEEIIRFSTFLKFSKDSHESPILLAKNGFYYIYNVDEKAEEVKCNFCGLTIKVKQEEGGILSNHNQKSPECPMVTMSPCQNKPWTATEKEKEFFFNEWIKQSQFQKNSTTASISPLVKDDWNNLVSNEIPAVEFIGRCSRRDVCHYHDIGRCCAKKNCAGITNVLEYPTKKSYISRLETLASVPSLGYDNLKHMIADAGYFCQNSCFWCFCCGDKKLLFSPTDVIMAEHAKTSPQCGYVRCEMGDDFVHLIQEFLKCDNINFEIVKQYLPQYEPWFTELSVTKRRKSSFNCDSAENFFDKMRGAIQYGQEIPACVLCSKDRSAVRVLNCCGILCCVDCCNRKKKCSCEENIEQSAQGHI